MPRRAIINAEAGDHERTKRYSQSGSEPQQPRKECFIRSGLDVQRQWRLRYRPEAGPKIESLKLQHGGAATEK